ncbi:MAG: nonstructural protein [Microvirus sp.]|nr:MAG: nonstructural protein [Microvirus sp.]
MNRIYAIRDTLAQALVGGLHLFKHDAAAVRFFTDVISDAQTMLHRHPNDHELICLGEVCDSGKDMSVDGFVGGPVVVITGSAWVASQTPKLEREA